MAKKSKWIQGVQKEIKKDKTAGSFTRQARRAGYANTVTFAKHVISANKSAEKQGKRKPFIRRTRNRAQFVLNVRKK